LLPWDSFPRLLDTPITAVVENGVPLLSLALLELGVRLLVADPSARVHFAIKSAGCCQLDPRLLWTLVPSRTARAQRPGAASDR
jgi:hypothetical protein